MVYHYPPSEDLLASIRAKARESLLPKGIDVRSLLEGAENGPPTGRISDRRFFSALEKVAGLVLDADEKAYVIRRFGDHRKIINYAKFYQALDIYVPRNHLEPSHYIDPLPQPYRRIVKVLEEDIWERAWRMIAQKHPEVLHTLYKEEVDLFKQDLQRECSASSWVEDDVGGVSALALDSATSCLFVGTHTGRVLVVNTDIGRITTTLAPFSDYPGSIAGISLSGLVAPPPQPSSLETLDVPSPSLLAAAFVNLPAGYTPPKPAEPPVTGAGTKDKKNKKDKDDGAVPEGPPAARVALLHVCGQNARTFASLSCRLPVSCVQLSRDGSFLAITTTDGALSLHKVPSYSSDVELGQEAVSTVSMAQIAEMDELVFRVADKLIDVPPPFFTLPPPGAPNPFSATEPLNPTTPITTPSPSSPAPLPTVHFLVAEPSPTLAPSDPSGRRLLRQPPATSGLLLWRTGSDRIQRYDFIKPAPAPVEAPPEPKKKGQGSTEAQAPPPPPPDLAGAFAGECQLPAPISASFMDASTYLLVLGLVSGSVLLWDLHAGGFREALGRHETGAVTALGLSHNRFVVSGGEDGRVHVYDLCPEAAEQESVLSVELRQLYGLKLPRLLGFRDDLTPPIVAIHMLEDVPLAIVQGGDPTLVVFDLQNAVPLGKVASPSDLELFLRPLPPSPLPSPPAPLDPNLPTPVSEPTIGSSQKRRVMLAPGVGTLVAAFVACGSQTQPKREEAKGSGTGQEAGEGTMEGKPDGVEPSAVDSPALKAQLAMFSSTQLIKGLCPAIASLAGSLTDRELKDVFQTMPPDVRRKPEAPPEYAARFLPPPAPTAAAKSVMSNSRRSPYRTHTRQLSTGGSFRTPAAANNLRSPSAHGMGAATSPLASPSRQPTSPLNLSDSKQRSESGSPKGHSKNVFSFDADVKLRSGTTRSGTKSPLASSSSSFRMPRTRSNASGLGALTKENLNIAFGSATVEPIKGVAPIRYLDPDEAVLRLKANRNANKEDRDGRVLETMQELLGRL